MILRVSVTVWCTLWITYLMSLWFGTYHDVPEAEQYALVYSWLLILGTYGFLRPRTPIGVWLYNPRIPSYINTMLVLVSAVMLFQADHPIVGTLFILHDISNNVVLWTRLRK